MPASRTLRRIAIAVALPIALSSTACVIRTTHTVERGAPDATRGDTLAGPVTLRLRDGATVLFPDGAVVRRDSVVAHVPARKPSSAARTAVDVVRRGPGRVTAAALPRSSAGRRTAAGATRPEFVAGVVADSVVAVRSTERRVNQPATVLANVGLAALAVVVLAVGLLGETGQVD